MKEKGFTLIELLAVIVILAVIALIATPIILNVIEKAKKGAAESSALGYVDAVEKTIAINAIDSNKTPIVDDSYTTDDLKTYGVTVKGEGPEDNSNSWVLIEKGRVKDYSLKIGDYIVNYDSSLKTAKVTSLTTPTKQPAGSVTVPTGPTYIAPQATDTHKGIIYLDPTDLTKGCDASNSVSITETKTGCMKWYIYDNSGDNYKLILDHNTTARIIWDSNRTYESSNLYAVVQDLKTTSKWVVNPDLITVEEVNSITGKTGFDTSSIGSGYYFDTKTQTKADFTSTRSKYDWLYNNLYKCKTDSTDYGCSIEDNNKYKGYGNAGEGQTWAYWTKTTVGIATSPRSPVWIVYGGGYTGGCLGIDFDVNNIGIRPVITIPKNIIK